MRTVQTWCRYWYLAGYCAMQDGERPSLRSCVAWWMLYRSPVKRWL